MAKEYATLEPEDHMDRKRIQDENKDIREDRLTIAEDNERLVALGLKLVEVYRSDEERRGRESI